MPKEHRNTHIDGSTETLQIGSPVFQRDILEINLDSAVNIVFMDETSFAISEDSSLAIDEYIFGQRYQQRRCNCQF